MLQRRELLIVSANARTTESIPPRARDGYEQDKRVVSGRISPALALTARKKSESFRLCSMKLKPNFDTSGSEGSVDASYDRINRNTASKNHYACALGSAEGQRKSKLCELSCSRSVRGFARQLVASAFT